MKPFFFFNYVISKGNSAPLKDEELWDNIMEAVSLSQSRVVHELYKHVFSYFAGERYE